MTGTAPDSTSQRGAFASSSEFAQLLRWQRLALRYFLENQTSDGLILDRQANHGPLRPHGLCSIAATGMGLIALALASAEPYHMLTHAEAVRRVRRCLEHVLNDLPQDAGILPHFVCSKTGTVIGFDTRSTVDSGWLVAGALWAARFLSDAAIEGLADQLYHRINWQYWTVPGTDGLGGLLCHGLDKRGQFLSSAWDRLNGETVFLYILAAGAAANRAWPASHWPKLESFPGSQAGLRFGSADLGLFVFQYGLDLLDLRLWHEPRGIDLVADANHATEANYRVCRAASDQFSTYRKFWGLSAGDGPAPPPDSFAYRCYSPAERLDGTAHITATLASIAHRPAQVWANVCEALRNKVVTSLGRYGFSSINLDHGWVARDMVGIDAGAAMLALENVLHCNRIRNVFHSLSCVSEALTRLQFTAAPSPCQLARAVSTRAFC